MTTSFPPINYPNKPVPPFTAEPPRNPFPGFFPDMWKNITGKPYITVSSKGLANGLSEYFNDGADFGPDSLQADGSLTQTVGIMEAVNYVYTQNGGKIKLSQGIYDLTNAPLIANVDSTRYSKIMIPYRSYLSPPSGEPGQIPITIEGAGIGNLLGAYPASGTIIRDNTLTATETYQSVIDANGSQDAGFNGVEVSLFNLGVIPKQGSSGISGIDFSYDLVAIFDNVFVQPQNINTPVSPSTGIKFPTEGCEFSYAGVLNIGGFYNGIISGEHMHINDLTMESCVNGISTGDMTHDMNIVHASVGACETAIYNTNVTATSILWIGKIQVIDRSSPYGGTAKYYISNNVNPASPIYIGVWHEGSSPVFSSLNAGIHNGLGVSGLINIGKVYPQDFAGTTLSANPPVSGTVYQNTNPYDIEIDLPVYATTSGTAGYVTVAKGSKDTPTAIGNQYVSGDTSSTATQIIRVRVPAGWYYSFTGSAVTFATATPFAE